MTQQGLWNGSDFSTTAKCELNNNSWTEDVPQTQYLVDLYKHGEAAMPNYEAALANGGWDPANQIFPARVGEVIDIIWENSNIPTPQYHTHPSHVHGSHVWNIGSGNGTYDAMSNAKKLEGYALMKRDTTLLYRYTSTGIADSTSGWRLKVDDAGIFSMHCHSLQHMIVDNLLPLINLETVFR